MPLREIPMKLPEISDHRHPLQAICRMTFNRERHVFLRHAVTIVINNN